MFPHDTCEISNNKYIKQPVSSFINIVSCVIILFYYQKYNSNLLLSLLLFQFCHAFFHSFHYHAILQQYIQHILAMNINFSLMRYYKYNIFLKTSIFIFILDIYYFCIKKNIIGGILTQTALLSLTIYKNVPIIFDTNQINYFIILTIILIILLINEKVNCKKMMKLQKLPYHALVEFFGLFYFYNLIKLFYHN